MCTNYRPSSREVALSWFGIHLPDDAWAPEAWPGSFAPFMRRAADATAHAREGVLGRFGLIPHWSRDEGIGRSTYNARSETVAEKPSFRDAWRRGQRCVVPMSAFFEPNWESGRAVRWRIERADREPFGVAGLWARWRAPNGVDVHSFSMLTINADAHPVMRRFHKPGDEKRMLVLLDSAEHDAWLAAPTEQALQMLKPCDPDLLAVAADPLPPRGRKSAARTHTMADDGTQDLGLLPHDERRDRA